MKLYNFFFKRNSNIKEEFVEDSIFYSETLSIMKYYLSEYSEGTSYETLKYFVEKVSLLRFSKFYNTKNEFTEFDLENNYNNNIQKYCNCKNNKYDIKNLDFLKQIRFCVLNTLGRKDIKNKNLLMEYHRVIYLLELSFKKDMSIFERLNDFLNTNYQLEEYDFNGHAIRGNFNEIIRIKPELADFICELRNILHSTDQNNKNKENFKKETKRELLKDLKKKYKIDNELFKIINGKYNRFESEIEEVCYNLAYKNELKQNLEEINIISGDFDCLIEKTNGWLKLVIFFIINKNITLEEFEKLFEKVYFQICNMEYQTALEYLAYCRICQYQFNILVKKIELNRGIMGLFSSYVQNNKLDGSFLEQEYLNYLKKDKDYDELCSYISKNCVLGFEYTLDIVNYFIKNYSNYIIFNEKKFIKDKNNHFIVRMNCNKNDTKEELEFLLEHEYSKFMLEKIVERIGNSKTKIKSLIPKTLELIIKQEKKIGKENSHILIKKLFSLLLV